MATSYFCARCGAANLPTASHCTACQEPLEALPEPSTLLSERGQELPALHTPSTLLNERYQVLTEIGAGGFGAVYQARDTQEHGRLVAVKQIHLKGLSPQQIIEATNAFNREAEILTALHHPQLPRIFDRFSDPDHWYLVMDFIDGQTLESYLQQQPTGTHHGLVLDETLTLGLQLCGVLHYLHAQQPPVIFRDLKPGNIMRTDGGRLYLIDFGIARRFKSGQAKDTIPFGSPGFAAPEQYGRAQTTPQADIYSLGALLYSLISGDDPSEHPFRFSPLRGFNIDGIRELDALIQHMVALDSKGRPASILEVQAELQCIQEIHTQAAASRVWAPPQSQTPPAADSANFSSQIQQQPQQDHVFYARPSLPQVAASPVVSHPNPARGASSPSLFSRRSLIGTGLGVVVSVLAGALTYHGPTPQMQTAQNGLPVPPDLSPTPAITSDPTTWSLDLRYLASVNLAQRQVKIWDAQSKQVMQTIPLPGNLQQLTIIWSADNQKILLYENPHFCVAWDLASGLQKRGPLFTLPALDITSASWSPDGQYLALGYHDTPSTTSFAVRRASDGKQLFGQRIDDGSNTTLTCLAWSSESRYVAFGGAITSDSSGMLTTPLEIWDSQTPQRLTQQSKVMNAATTITALAWSPSGHTLGIITGDTLWLDYVASSHSVLKGLDLSSIFSTNGYFDSAPRWSPNEKYLALLNGGTLFVLDLANQKALSPIDSDRLVALAWSPDGKSITLANQNNNLASWSIE